MKHLQLLIITISALRTHCVKEYVQACLTSSEWGKHSSSVITSDEIIALNKSFTMFENNLLHYFLVRAILHQCVLNNYLICFSLLSSLLGSYTTFGCNFKRSHKLIWVRPGQYVDGRPPRYFSGTAGNSNGASIDGTLLCESVLY